MIIGDMNFFVMCVCVCLCAPPVMYIRKLKREKRARRRLEEQLSEKMQRLTQIEPKDGAAGGGNLGISIRGKAIKKTAFFCSPSGCVAKKGPHQIK